MEPAHATEATTPDHDIGSRLRAERDRQGLSLRKLAGKLEISPSALSQIETGKSRPSVKTLYAVVSELGISLDELFDHHGLENTSAGAAAAVADPAAGWVPSGPIHRPLLRECD